MAPSIQTAGLRDLAKALAGTDAAKPLAKVNKTAGEKAVNEGRRLALGGRRATVRAARSLRAGQRRRSATVSLGGSGAPQALGENFGARHNELRTSPNGRRFRGYNQFPEGRSNEFFLSGIDAALPAIADEYADELIKAFTQ